MKGLVPVCPCTYVTLGFYSFGFPCVTAPPKNTRGSLCSRDLRRVPPGMKGIWPVFLPKFAFVYYVSIALSPERLSGNPCWVIGIGSDVLTLTHRSIVLLSTRGEIKPMNISDSLVLLGLVKPAHLHSKGLCLQHPKTSLGCGSGNIFMVLLGG